MEINEEYRKQVREELCKKLSQENPFSFMDKARSLGYHFAMVLFGELLCKEKYDRYITAFEELCKLEDEKKN